MKYVKKVIALLIAGTLIVSLSACKNRQDISASTDDFNDTTVDSNSTEDTTPSAPQKNELSSDSLIAYIKNYGTENGFGSNFVSDTKTESDKKTNETDTSFTYYYGLVSANVTEMHDLVQTIMLAAIPGKFSEIFPSNTTTENIQYAFVACLQLFQACEPEKDLDWHQEQLKKAPNEGDESIVIGTYTSDQWQYTAMVSEYYVSCVATRYCSQCKTNAPTVTFSSVSGLCNRCLTGQDPNMVCRQCGTDCTYKGLEQGNLCSDCYDKKNSGNSGTTVQPSSCSHNYAAATCTKPQTCTLCGATSGSTLDHTWAYTSCTTNKACTACKQELFGSTPGHQWAASTCTEPGYCTVCKETGDAARGHRMLFTKCAEDSCDFTDYSCIAGTYTNISSWGYPVGTTTSVDLTVTSVSISNSGVLSYTYNGNVYELTLQQTSESDRFTAYFDCYLNGQLVEGLDFRAGNELYDYRIHLDGYVIDGCKVYWNATR